MPDSFYQDEGIMRQSRRRQRRGLDATPRAIAQEPEVMEINVGHRLRELRTAQGLSIRSLAEVSGLNFNTLSLIETGKTSPSVGTLQRLALALRVPITAFFEIEPTRKNIVYQKAGQHPRGVFAHGFIEDLGAGLTLNGGQPLLVTLSPGANSGTDPIVHTGHEFVFCLEGCLTYTIEGREYLLEPGDSLIFEAHLPHRWGNAEDTPSHSLLIICPADENDRPTEFHFSPG